MFYQRDGTRLEEKRVRWLYEPGSLTPAARFERGKLHYSISDHQGTVRELLDEQGEMVWGQHLTTWGHAEKRGGVPSHHPDYHVQCHFRFLGQYFDEESGLCYNRFRYYSNETGQYISPDPIGLEGGLNPYGYVHNPSKWVDPYGLAGEVGNKGDAGVGESNIVYRALTTQDAKHVAAGQSIQGKAVNGKWSAAEHVANQPLNPGSSAAGGPMANSPWISTTKNPDIARSYDGGNGIVAIDLNKVSSPQVEVWKHAPRTNGVEGLPYHRSIWAEEVTIYQEIPNSAIVGKIK